MGGYVIPTYTRLFSIILTYLLTVPHTPQAGTGERVEREGIEW